MKNYSLPLALIFLFSLCTPALAYWRHHRRHSQQPQTIFFQEVVSFTGVQIGDIHGRIITHGLDCRPTVVVDSDHDIMIPWVTGVTAETFQIRVRNLGVPPADVDITATFWCID